MRTIRNIKIHSVDKMQRLKTVQAGGIYSNHCDKKEINKSKINAWYLIPQRDECYNKDYSLREHDVM